MTITDLARLGILGMLTAASSLALGAQSQSPDSLLARAADCRGFNGIFVDAWWGDTGNQPGESSDSSGFRFDGRTTLDTTFTFNLSERRWTKPSVNAVVMAGVSSTGRGAATAPPGGGTNAAPSSDGAGGSGGRDWHVCTGATLSGKQPTLLLRGVRGQMRLKVDLTPLASIRGGGLTDSTRTPRR